MLLASSPFLYSNLAFQSSHDYYDYDPDEGDALVREQQAAQLFYTLETSLM